MDPRVTANPDAVHECPAALWESSGSDSGKKSKAWESATHSWPTAHGRNSTLPGLDIAVTTLGTRKRRRLSELSESKGFPTTQNMAQTWRARKSGPESGSVDRGSGPVRKALPVSRGLPAMGAPDLIR